MVYETRSSIIIREIMISDKMILKAYDKNLEDIEIILKDDSLIDSIKFIY